MPDRVVEFHSIMPIGNIPSVLKHGILSHKRATNLPHSDVSMMEVQDRRDKMLVPGGLPLHRYANLYFDAHNPMMYKRLAQVESLCVLSVSIDVLKLPGAMITDQNAASDYARFYSPTELNNLPFDRIFAEDWRHPDDEIDYWQHKSQKCAEVLAPNVIPTDFIQKAYVVNETTKTKLSAIGFPKPIEIMPRLFFR
uniref:DarT domain-containing protein n=1 Tax=Candidatus Kentrum sp. FW TaxID=2126338 RepID=A0A450SU19_9GAMM|nr:MAG: protein of unknown function (DUF4433) [Candidatus Kentron sp. FW]